MLKFATVALFIVPAINAFAAPPVIYGEDNRVEIFEASPFQQKLAASAATMIQKEKIIPLTDRTDTYQVDQMTFNSSVGGVLCADERFREQPNAGTCSGFLIGPDLLVTAGHCVKVNGFCEDYSWVFDFKVNPLTGKAGDAVPKENIYSCKKVISFERNDSKGLDYGLIQLDRRVEGRNSLAVRSEGTVSSLAELVVIGSPSGLPLKVAAGASVRLPPQGVNPHPEYFVTNLDTYQGNSGSAVFNATTGIVEGILVRGNDDFREIVQANGQSCWGSVRCASDECRGEDVSRMTSIPELDAIDELMGLAETGDVKKLEALLSQRKKFWVDIYGADGKSALIKAAAKNHRSFVEEIIEHGADVKLQDALGNSALHALSPKLGKKSEKLLKLLLTKGADIEAKNELGETPVLTAARELNLAGVKMLIASGANKLAVNKNGEDIVVPFEKSGNKKAVSELKALMAGNPTK